MNTKPSLNEALRDVLRTYEVLGLNRRVETLALDRRIKELTAEIIEQSRHPVQIGEVVIGSDIDISVADVDIPHFLNEMGKEISKVARP